MNHFIIIPSWWLRTVELYLLLQVIWNTRKGLAIARQIDWDWWWDDILHGKGWS